MKTGRPRLVNLNSEAKRFLDLYLDPLMSAEMICQLTGIKKSTFYNYEKELNLPQLKVGFGVSTAHLPREKVLGKLTDRDQIHELNVIRKLGRDLQARVKIVTVDCTDCRSVDNLIYSKKVDFVVSSITKTKKRSEDLYFSQDYFFDGGPFGVLMHNPTMKLNLLTSKNKPILGVTEHSVHAEYALSHLNQEFKIKKFRSGRKTLLALISGLVDFTLMHPSWLTARVSGIQDLQICSKPMFYSTHSAILFHADSQLWIPQVNESIERLHENHLADIR